MRGCSRIGILAASCLVLLLTSQVLAEDISVVARFDSGGAFTFGESMRMVLTFDTVKGQHLQVGVENIDEKLSKADPKKDLLDQFKTLEPGDIVKLTYRKWTEKNVFMLVRVEPYPMQAGMELPNAFVFKEMYDHTDNEKTQTLVDAKKFDDIVTFALQQKKDTGGKMAPDPDLVATLGKLKEGQVVLIDAISGTPHPILRSIEPYNTPQTGTIKSIKPGELNGNKTKEADIDVDGTVVTALVPGHLDGRRWILDPKVLGELQRFKTGSLVTFRTTDDNGTTLLRDIVKAAPKPKEKELGKTSGK